MAIRAFYFICFAISVLLIWFFLALNVHAHDGPLHGWFNSLKSGSGGSCCSYADGRTVEDPDVEMAGNHYRVRVDGEWVDVPDDALVTVPNRFGQAVVWPYKGYDGQIHIRCFLPGAGT